MRVLGNLGKFPYEFAIHAGEPFLRSFPRPKSFGLMFGRCLSFGETNQRIPDLIDCWFPPAMLIFFNIGNVLSVGCCDCRFGSHVFPLVLKWRLRD